MGNVSLYLPVMVSRPIRVVPIVLLSSVDRSAKMLRCAVKFAPHSCILMGEAPDAVHVDKDAQAEWMSVSPASKQRIGSKTPLDTTWIMQGSRIYPWPDSTCYAGSLL